MLKLHKIIYLAFEYCIKVTSIDHKFITTWSGMCDMFCDLFSYISKCWKSKMFKFHQFLGMYIQQIVSEAAAQRYS